MKFKHGEYSMLSSVKLKQTKLPEHRNFWTNGIRVSVGEAIIGCFPWVDKPRASRGAGLNLGHLTPACIASSPQ